MIFDYPKDVPITGPCRFPALLFYVVIILESFNICVIFFRHYLQHKENLRGTLMHVAWGALFTGFALMCLVYIFSDFYTENNEQRYFIMQFGYVCGSAGCFAMIFIIERVQIFYKRRIFTHILGIAFIILIILIIISFTVPLGNLVQFFANFFWLPIIGFMFGYFIKIGRMVKGKLRLNTIIMFIGAFSLILGVIGATDMVLRTLGALFLPISQLLQIIGIFLISVFSLRLPSWQEIEYKNAIYSLMVIYKGGELLFEHDFIEHDKRISSIIVAGSIESSTTLLEGVFKTGTLKVLDLEQKKILLEKGENITIALVAEAQLESLEFLLHATRMEFESFFSAELEDWKGDKDIFKPARYIIEKIFA
ncbi:MAG: hypothetical protein ACFFCS_15475 [Candidatus Hodarchaeota archaeon]